MNDATRQRCIELQQESAYWAACARKERALADMCDDYFDAEEHRLSATDCAEYSAQLAAKARAILTD